MSWNNLILFARGGIKLAAVPVVTCARQYCYKKCNLARCILSTQLPSVGIVGKTWSLRLLCDDAYDLELTAEAAHALLMGNEINFIDVREPHELVEEGKIPGSINIPLGQLVEAMYMDEDSFKDKYGIEKPTGEGSNLAFYCKRGIRSRAALDAAVSAGFTRVKHLSGGYDAWKEFKGVK